MGTWYLIENNSHEVLTFSSKEKLRQYAMQKNLEIRKSPIDEHCYYTESVEILPCEEYID